MGSLLFLGSAIHGTAQNIWNVIFLPKRSLSYRPKLLKIVKGMWQFAKVMDVTSKNNKFIYYAGSRFKQDLANLNNTSHQFIAHNIVKLFGTPNLISESKLQCYLP